MVTIQQRADLQNELRTKSICRFCLSQQTDKLWNFYSRDKRIQSSAPLTVQVLACASMEIFEDDGMPQWICIDCRILFEHFYRFKQMCKKGEQLLRQVPLTGVWPKELSKPKFPQQFLNKTSTQETKNVLDVPLLLAELEPQPTVKAAIPQKLGNVTITRAKPAIPTSTTESQSNNQQPKKLLNANPAKSPEPPAPKRLKKEIVETEEDPTTVFLNKVENEEELSMDDLHRLIEASTVEDVTHEFKEKSSPKVLNKSSVRILNKEANKMTEPKFKKPEVKRDREGNVAIVTEIIDPTVCFIEQERSLKDVPEVETDVFPCPHCERSFPLRQLRDIHVINHTRERSNPCQHCNKSFFSKYDLQKHIVTHTGEKPYVCTICNKGFTRSTLLHRHERLHTDVPKYICLHCEKTFLSQEEMEKHAERHNKKRPFQCNVCQKCFAFKQGLDRHLTTHATDQPFPCHYCDQTFLTASKLARHLTAHAGRRPYPCKFCPKSFLLSHHLTRHLRNHKQCAANFECHSCKSVFKTRTDLIYHTAEHAKLSLVCVLCREQLPAEDKVEEHIAKHASSDAHGCEFCDLMFLTDQSLQDHISEEHADDLLTYMEDDKKQETKETEKAESSQKNEKISSVKEKQSMKAQKIEQDTQAEEDFLESIQEYLNDDDNDVPVRNEAQIEDVEYLDADMIEDLNHDEADLLNTKDEDESIEEEEEEKPNVTKGRRSSSQAANTSKEIKAQSKESPSKGRPFAAVKTGGVAKAVSAPSKAKPTDTKQISKEAKVIEKRPTTTGRTTRTSTMNITNIKQEKKSPVVNSKSPKNIAEADSTMKKVESAVISGQKINLSKTEVNAMAKQGRLRIKDGKIVVTRRSNEK